MKEKQREWWLQSISRCKFFSVTKGALRKGLGIYSNTWPVYLTLLGFYSSNHWWILKYPYNEDDTALQSIMAFVLVSLGSGMGGHASIFPVLTPLLSLFPLICSPVLLYIFALGSFISSVSGCGCAPAVLLWSECSLQLDLSCHRSGRKGRPSGCFCLSLVHPDHQLPQTMVVGEHSVLLDPFNTFLCRSEISAWSSELLKYEWQFCLLLVRPSLVPSEALQSH